MSSRTGALLALAAAAIATALAVAAGSAPASASVPNVPLASPAPGSPVFASFRPVFEPSRHTTTLEIAATGAGLAYVWSIEGQSCGALSDPGGRTARNGYFHRDCAFEEETAARVSVLVARAADLGSDGRPRGDDVPRFVYSQVARAGDSPDTRGLDPKAVLQYFGPAGAGPTSATAQPGPTSAPGPSGEPDPTLIAILGGIFIALSVVGFNEWAARRDPCDLLDALCDRAHAAARGALEARERAYAAADRAREVLHEATAARERAEATVRDLPSPPEHGTRGSYTGRDITILAEADRAGDRRAPGEISDDRIERLRARDRAADTALRRSASAAADAARTREAASLTERDAAEAAQRAADGAYDAAVETQRRVCAASELCVRPARPRVAAPPPTLVESPAPIPARERAGGCCPGQLYWGFFGIVETCTLPVVTKLLDGARELIWGESYNTSWLATGHESWTGTLYCAGDDSKFFTIAARAERRARRGTGGLGASVGVVVVICDGVEHPQDVVAKIPQMMAGWGADIVLPGAATAARTATRTATSGVRRLVPTLARWASEFGSRVERQLPGASDLLEGVLRGLGLARGVPAGAAAGAAASRAGDAEGCLTVPLSIGLQGGWWHVREEDVHYRVEAYGCCEGCAGPRER